VLRSRGPDLAVLLDEHPPDDPGTANRQHRETSRGTETDGVAGIVLLGPHVGTIDVTDLSTNVGHG
jgi:hypothetical protein